jgi:hypothetical protein
VKLPKTFLAVNLSDAFTFQEKQHQGDADGGLEMKQPAHGAEDVPPHEIPQQQPQLNGSSWEGVNGHADEHGIGGGGGHHGLNHEEGEKVEPNGAAAAEVATAMPPAPEETAVEAPATDTPGAVPEEDTTTTTTTTTTASASAVPTGAAAAAAIPAAPASTDAVTDLSDPQEGQTEGGSAGGEGREE